MLEHASKLKIGAQIATFLQIVKQFSFQIHSMAKKFEHYTFFALKVRQLIATLYLKSFLPTKSVILTRKKQHLEVDTKFINRTSVFNRYNSNFCILSTDKFYWLR